MTGGITIADKLANYFEDLKIGTTPEGDTSGTDVLSRYLKERRNDYYAWQIIVFFAEHPYIKFNRLAVIGALNHNHDGRYIQMALDGLIEQKIIKESADRNLPLYSLAEDMRRLVLKLTRPARKE